MPPAATAAEQQHEEPEEPLPSDLPPIVASPSGPFRAGAGAKLRFGVGTGSKPDGAFVTLLNAAPAEEQRVGGQSSGAAH